MKFNAQLIVILMLLATVGLGCSSSESETSETTNAATAEVQQTDEFPVHPAAGVTVYDVDGRSHQLSEWIGQQPVVINFWGTWCPPCRREIPGLVRLYDEYRERGVEIVSLAMERRAGPQQVKTFAEQAGMEWVQLMANEYTSQVFGLTGSVPTTIFLDENGVEVARHVGARPYDIFKLDFEKIASGS